MFLAACLVAEAGLLADTEAVIVDAGGGWVAGKSKKDIFRIVRLLYYFVLFDKVSFILLYYFYFQRLQTRADGSR